jgi:hypothetical protein
MGVIPVADKSRTLLAWIFGEFINPNAFRRCVDGAIAGLLAAWRRMTSGVELGE